MTTVQDEVEPPRDRGTPPGGYVWADTYAGEHRKEWPSRNSFQWFLRMNRQVLVDARALGVWRGGLVVHPERMDEVIPDLLLRGALAVLARGDNRRRRHGLE